MSSRIDSAALKEFILESLSLYDMLEDDGHIHTARTDMTQQMHCPFHGADRKPSARYYKETNSMHCWVCGKSWDPISYTMDKKAMSWSEAARYLIRANKLSVKHLPTYESTVRSRVKKAGESSKKEAPKVDNWSIKMVRLEKDFNKKKYRLDAKVFRTFVYTYPRIKILGPGDPKACELAEKLQNKMNEVTL